MIKEIPKAIKNPKTLEKYPAGSISKQEQVKGLGFSKKKIQSRSVTTLEKPKNLCLSMEFPNTNPLLFKLSQKIQKLLNK